MGKVAIVNYQLGNLRSVENALDFLGAKVFIAESPSELTEASHIILPGVGAFGDGMSLLHQNGWIAALQENVREQKKPFLGICLGMQLCAKTGLEHGENQGLDFVSGTVKRLSDEEPDIRIPHIGWNTVTPGHNSLMFKNMPDQPCFYFVHSYALTEPSEGAVLTYTEHGQSFISAFEKDNIWCAQFHPEKSQKDGLVLLKNFMEQ